MVRTSSINRRGFTLVELLVVITIIVILTAATVVGITRMTSGERVNSGARQIQSALMGARDRAIFAKAPRGLRFTLDKPQHPAQVRTMTFLSATPPWTTGAVTIGRADLDNDSNPDSSETRTLRLDSNDWLSLKERGLIVTGSRIRLPATGSWYTIDVTDLTSINPNEMRISTDYRDTTGFAAMPALEALTFTDYELELQPALSPNEEPITLPAGVVIDLAKSFNMPPGDDYFDFMFSPRGAILGSNATLGVVHLYVCELGDAELGADPAVSQGDKLAVTIRTMTGNVSTHKIDPTDANSDNVADHPWTFADTGE